MPVRYVHELRTTVGELGEDRRRCLRRDFLVTIDPGSQPKEIVDVVPQVDGFARVDVRAHHHYANIWRVTAFYSQLPAGDVGGFLAAI
jgi:hypothetical protein